MFLLYSRLLHFSKFCKVLIILIFGRAKDRTVGGVNLTLSSANLGATVLSMDPQIVSLAAAKMATTNDKMHDG